MKIPKRDRSLKNRDREADMVSPVLVETVLRKPKLESPSAIRARKDAKAFRLVVVCDPSFKDEDFIARKLDKLTANLKECKVILASGFGSVLIGGWCFRKNWSREIHYQSEDQLKRMFDAKAIIAFTKGKDRWVNQLLAEAKEKGLKIREVGI